MSETINNVVYDAIQKYLADNGYNVISPNLLNDTTQQELAQVIGNAISRYLGEATHRKI
jgi:hypothetical protein